MEMKWSPTDFSNTAPHSAISKWIVTPTSTNLKTEVYKLNGERDRKNQAGSTPTKSLCLVIQNPFDGQWTNPRAYEVQKSPSILFQKIGESIKYLCIRGVTMSIPELYKLLRQTPNLETLKIFEEDVISDWSFDPFGASRISDKDPPLLPKVVNLTVFCDSFETAGWLLEMVSKQLLTLNLINWNFLTWDVVRYPKGLPVLENLKIGRSRESMLVELNTIPMRMLKRLSIQVVTQFNAHLNFIASFKNSLVELTLEYIVLDWEKVADWAPPCFNKLKQLSLITTMSETMDEFETKLLSARFPAIKTLTLIHRLPMGYERAREYNTSRGHWNISSSLETILWITGDHAKENVQNHAFTRPE